MNNHYSLLCLILFWTSYFDNRLHVLDQDGIDYRIHVLDRDWINFRPYLTPESSIAISQPMIRPWLNYTANQETRILDQTHAQRKKKVVKYSKI